jgi:cellulose synthase/poly-beta-1,6-N-acetylglucosamine synthase-like glycosyltransferase
MISTTFFFIGLCATAATFLFYPLLLLVMAWLRISSLSSQGMPKEISRRSTNNRLLPSVQMVIVGYVPGALLSPKLENSLNLDYPADKLSLMIGFDGALDALSAREPLLHSPRVTVIESAERLGKCATINRVMEQATAEVVVFTDMDAMLTPNTLRQLVRRFDEPDVGGVCGRRVIGEQDAGLTLAQNDYIDFDCRIKTIEEKAFGSITSNDGKLYAMRRDLFEPLPAAVTDDLYNGLSVTLAGSRMVFEGTAIALIRKPSRSGRHEIGRRRRIVCRSLAGMFSRPKIFLFWRYHGYGLALFFNKVNRRLLPVYLLVILVAAMIGASESPILAIALFAQLVLYAIAILYGAIGDGSYHLSAPLHRLGGLSFYFLVGNLGILLGWWDYLVGKRAAVWEPIKDDGPVGGGRV